MTAKDLLKRARNIGIEFDHITMENKTSLEDTFPGATFVDVAKFCMNMRMIKSEEEIELTAKSAAIAEVGAAAAKRVMKEGIAEYEVAMASTKAMVNEIAKIHPNAELMDSKLLM